ncbi:hypothetical protein L1987_36044 [Smallanthus sonchifolius]|uniref:Uncharacterized protein n=1 Tax=Smallanthus sonchifolius TaxID=185202 RepID=A0ACB9HCF1_9ASTR|nr:hypothetical protein L1987_36044 [Smallanthus sonchifolius]
MRAFSKLVFFSVALFSLLSNSAAVDTITAGQALGDNDTIVSRGEMYELGFFSPGNSKNRYLGIWFKKISPRTVVWVANRDTPLTSTTGVFTVDSNGLLLLLSGNGTMIWSSSLSVSVSNDNAVAKLLDSGNLVVCDNSSTVQDFIWQSFDYPTDTLLAGMKLGKDLVRGIDRYLTSWKSSDDPSPGLYKIWMDTNGYPQAFQSRGSVLQLRFGPWNGVRFSGFPSKPNPIYTYDFFFNEKEVYTIFHLINSSIISRVYLGPEGNHMRLNWIDPSQGWIPYLAATVDSCAQYGLCGVNGICNINSSPACSCMEGFEPRYPVQWNAGNWSGGCQREKPLNCGNEEGFQKLSGVKLPDTQNSWYNLSVSLKECEHACKRNCSCTAYGNLDIRRGGSGCLLWFDDLMDVREYNEDQDVYIRIAKSNILAMESLFKRDKVIEVVVATMVSLVLVGLAVGVYVWKKKQSPAQRQGNLVKALSEDYTGGSQKKDLELPFFSFSELSKMTNNFSINNKLGEGGFGTVYKVEGISHDNDYVSNLKGVMEDGQEIAVKRLSETSTQGVDEFLNEVRCIHRLQHRNLVKLMGFCVQKNEIMLIYEYMPNRSLDTLLFDEIKSSIGYIPPEYAVHGVFSVKSDVFSFGVLVLEIVSGMKNREFSSQEHSDNLLGHWTHDSCMSSLTN